MKKNHILICIVACLSVSLQANNITDQNALPNENTPEQVSESTTHNTMNGINPAAIFQDIYSYIRNTNTVGLCSISFGAGLLCKRHPLTGLTCIGFGLMARIKTEYTGHAIIKDGISTLSNAQSGDDVMYGTRKIAIGVCACAQDGLAYIQKCLEKKA